MDDTENKSNLSIEENNKTSINYRDISLYTFAKEVHLKKLINEPILKNFLFLRHGSTDWNIKMLILGPQDLSLNEMGKEQVKLCTSKKLNYANFDSIISSHLKRCTETKDIVLESINIPLNKIKIDKALEERNFGDWSTYRDLIKIILDNGNKVKYKEIQYFIESNLPVNAETVNEFEIRIGESMVKHLQQNSIQEIPLIISHGCVKSVIMKFMDLDDCNVDYGDSISFNFLNNKWNVSSMNEYELMGNTNDFIN